MRRPSKPAKAAADLVSRVDADIRSDVYRGLPQTEAWKGLLRRGIGGADREPRVFTATLTANIRTRRVLTNLGFKATNKSDPAEE